MALCPCPRMLLALGAGEGGGAGAGEPSLRHPLLGYPPGRLSLIA